MNISFGCQTYTWKLNKERFAGDLPHIADVTAKAGYTGLESEIDMLGDYFNRAELTKEIMDGCGISLAAIVLHQDWAGYEESAQEKELSDKAIDFIRQFPGAKIVLSHHALPGDRKEGDALSERRERLFACMAQVTGRAMESGVVTAFHPNSSVNSLFRTAEDYGVLFDMLDKTDIGLAPDIGHIANGGMDPLDVLMRFRSKVRHIHFKDRSGYNTWALMGNGSIDYPSIVSYLESTGYRGWIMVEDESHEAELDSDKAVFYNGEYIKRFIH